MLVQYGPSTWRQWMNLPWSSRLGQVALALFSFALVALGVPLAQQEDPAGLWVRAGLERTTVLKILGTPGSSGVRIALVEGRGIYRSTEGGAGWTSLTSGLPVDHWGRINVASLTMSQHNPAVMYAGMAGTGGEGSTESAGLYVTDNGGASWRSLARDMAGKDVQAIALTTSSETGTTTVCVGTNDGIYCSDDQGVTWSRLGWHGVETRITCLAFGPVTTRTLYVGTDGYGLYGTSNAGSSWKELNEGLASPDIHDIAVSTADPGTLYVGTDSGAYRTNDGGLSWESVAALAGKSILSLTVGEGRSTALYAGTYRGAAFRSADAGEHWERLWRGLGDLTVYSILIDPGSPSIIWAGTSDGVWRCVLQDRGAGFTPLPSASAVTGEPQASSTGTARAHLSLTPIATASITQPLTATVLPTGSRTLTHTATPTIAPTGTGVPSLTATPSTTTTATRTVEPTPAATATVMAAAPPQLTVAPTEVSRPRPTETRIIR